MTIVSSSCVKRACFSSLVFKFTHFIHLKKAALCTGARKCAQPFSVNKITLSDCFSHYPNFYKNRVDNVESLVLLWGASEQMIAANMLLFFWLVLVGDVLQKII